MIMKIREAQNMKQLDALRVEIIKHCQTYPWDFKALQTAFKSRKAFIEGGGLREKQWNDARRWNE